MNIRFITLVILTLTCFNLSAQNKIKGIILNEKNKPIENAHIVVNNKWFGTTNKAGAYQIDKITGKDLLIKISHLSYKSLVISYKVDSTKNTLPIIRLKKEAVKLDQVNITAKAIPMIQKGDTIEFNVVAFKLEPNASARQLVDAIPGMTRDQNNKLHYNGKAVTAVRVDDRIFHKNVDATLEALPADIIKKVQVYDDKSELAKFTGFDDGQRFTTINLVTKYENLKFGVGKYTGGHGTNDRYDYSTTNSFFLGASRLHLSGSLGNVSSSMGDSPYTQTSLPGNNKLGNIKSSYSYEHKNKKLYTDYSLNTNTAEVNTDEIRKYIGEDRVLSITNRDKSFNRTHGLNMDFRTYIGKRNKIRFTPFFSQTDISNTTYLNNLNELDGKTVSNISTNTRTVGKSKRFGGDMKWQTILSKKLYMAQSVSTEFKHSDKTKTISQIPLKIHKDHWIDKTDKLGYRNKLVYMLGKSKGICLYNKLQYKGQYNKQNDYEKELNYLKYRCMVGFMRRYQLNGSLNAYIGYELTNSLNAPALNDYSSLVGSFKYTKGISPRVVVGYNRNATTPNLFQVYGLEDKSNPTQVTIGNENLKQSYTNSLRFGLGNWKKLNIMSAFNWSENYIASSNWIKEDGTLVQSYMNMNDFYSANINVSKTTMKSTVSLRYNYSNMPSYYNHVKNISRQNTIALELMKAERMNPKYRYAIANQASYNWSYNTGSNTKMKFFTNELSGFFKIFDIKKFYAQIDYAFMYDYQPNIEDKHQTRNILDLEIGRRFCSNKLELSFKCNDMLKENQSIQQKFNPNYIENRITNSIDRYYMVSLKYHFNTLRNRGGMQMRELRLKNNVGF